MNSRWPLLALLLCLAATAAAQNGVATHDDLLMGFHFNQFPRSAPATELNTEFTFEEFTDCLAEDLPYLTYADFWVVWADIERYKGDDKGLANLDRAVNRALALGLKVKLVLIHSTWWAHDLDWAPGQILAIGPENLEDWAHWCQLMGAHFRGRVAQYDLQGEANGKDYWPFEKPADILAHVEASYRVGCRAIRQVAPEALIGVSCATPGVGGIDIYDQKIDRAELDRWYRDNLTACKGLFDCAPINYFADIPGADPYGGGFAFYQSVRRILDGLGLPQVELGSGESSINWADSSYDLKKYGLSIPAQARRLNATLGATFDAGMNKWVFHGQPQPPGFGWTWRWGFRKYEDFWGVWPEANKVPGTRIVWRYDNPDGRKVDYRPAFARPADPHLPSWEIWKFWAQSAPCQAGGRRLPVEVSGGEGTVWGLGSFLARRNEAVALVCNEKPAPLHLKLRVAPAGWPDGTELAVGARAESISFETGDRKEQWRKEGLRTAVKDGVAALELPPASGWTTVNLKPSSPAFAAELAGVLFPAQAQAGERVRGRVVLRNTGAAVWPKGNRVSLWLWTGNEAKPAPGLEVQPLAATVRPGESGCFEATLPPVEEPQLKTWTLRPVFGTRGGAPPVQPSGPVREAGRGRGSPLPARVPPVQPFGPVLEVSCPVVDTARPRKLTACRELGHIRLAWFRPQDGQPAHGYEVCRSLGLGQPKQLLRAVAETGFVDSEVEPDKVYEYYVVALGADDRRSRPSNWDSARALSKRRLWDAEVTAYKVPAQVRRGEPATASVTLRNTGSKGWDLRPNSGQRVWLQTAQLWGDQNEGRLPQLALGAARVVEPGQEVTLTFPYVGREAGDFENHWCLRLDTKAGGSAWFGSPLRAQTRVTE